MSYERRIELGSQLFINRRDDPGTVRAAVRRFAESGLKVIRLFLFWDYVERFEGEWDFSQFDACFEQAEESGVQIVPTLMPVSPPGYMCISTGVQDIADLNDPAYWTKAMEYVRRTVLRYRASPALHSWILWNEPTRHIRKTEHSIRALREYLREYYGGDIEAVNRLYYNRYTSFDEIEKNYQTQVENLSFRGYSESTDWTRFTCYDLCRRLSDIGAEIRKWDDHPIHVNPHDVGRNIIAGGQSVWQVAKVVDWLRADQYRSNPSLAEMAAVSRMPMETFRKRFVSEVGMPPLSYLLRCKMERAKDLLREPNCTVRQVGADVGMQDPYHFSKQFKAIVGISPSVFIRLVSNPEATIRRDYRGKNAADKP